jgi:hypothetical protein
MAIVLSEVAWICCNCLYALTCFFFKFEHRVNSVDVQRNKNPHNNSFRHNLPQFRETGSVDRKKDNSRPTKRTQEAIANVRQVMEEVPPTSVRQLSQQVQLYLYRLQAIQQLLQAVYPVHVEYCHRFLTLQERICSTGVSTLTNRGFTWTVISTHKTCDGGVQKNLISLKRFHFNHKR